MEFKELSKKLIDVIPRSMQRIRVEMRQAASAELSVPQFRVMAHLYSAYLRANPLVCGQTNRELAQAIGTSVPSMSRMVDMLVQRGLITRQMNPKDRREVSLTLSPKGIKMYQKFRDGAQEGLTQYLKKMEPAKRIALFEGLAILEEVFPGRGSA